MIKHSLMGIAILGVAASAQAFDHGTLALQLVPTAEGYNDWHGTLDSQGFGGFAGLLNFVETDTDHPGNSLGAIVTLCSDLTSAVVSPINVNIFDPTSSFGLTNLTLAGNMMATEAQNLGGDLTLMSNDQAFALQLDIWEVQYDGSAEANPDFSGGHFRSTTAITANQQAWADVFWGYRNNALDSIFLQAEGSSLGYNGQLGQDQLTVRGGGTRIFTPEPVTMSLGIAGVALFVRRRAAKKS